MNLRNLQTSILFQFILGMTIRFFIAPFTEQRWDMYIWRLSQAFVYGYRINPFWPDPGAPLEFAWGYPPLWLFILLLVFPAYTLMSPISYPQNPSALWNPHPWSSMTEMFESYRNFIPQNLPILDLLTKTPILIADGLIAVLLFKLIGQISDERTARYAYLAWLFNPFVIWVSSVWGSFDSITALFVLLSVFFLVKSKFSSAGIALSVGISLKLYPVVLVPVFGLMAYKRSKKITEGVKLCLISAGLALLVTFTTYLAFAAFAGQEPLNMSVKLMSGLLIKRASPDWMGQNMVSGLTPLIIFRDVLGPVNVPLSPILMSTSLLLILIKLYRTDGVSTDNIISYSAITHFLIYMTYTVVNTQYLLWIMPLLLALLATKKSRWIWYFYWVISFIGLIALIYSFDLSYHISPYFSPEYHAIFIRPELLAAAIGLAVLYIVGIKLVLRKPGGNKSESSHD